ncbi:calcium and calcium/calmodulin-dependent serine/threonine-protein kinase [Selaginella moellendorffii]|uniref:calcium and calcium/calmodulin-dependent serine/threonine-protein kinase n=1 Tax=Selaginella moellendorffii TaxID=88036 RepID=UPI000D1CB1E5|nr:calcium and calcium/calmodulin-dependent serine/threonine-protein kinase [Selaginella moellendorffii]|eukprot:XP_024537988.1 calcium and calcium/calmodulin-dependent serine/threonine-protein kinase [Selaginella moellendorffii]
MSLQDSNGRHRLQDDYIIGPVLGYGGFSVVRKGVHKENGTEVAIKTLRKQGFGYGDKKNGGRPLAGATKRGRGSRGRKSTAGPTQDSLISEALVANEIIVMQRIVENVSPHPNIVHLHDVYEDEAGVHLVLELCSGGELFDRIVAQEKYSEAQAAKVVKELATGLCSLHDAGIVHRDLKPENCLFLTPEEDNHLKIMDFGLSQIDGATSPIVGMFGSVDYVAPETLSHRDVLPASDMWSLGVILYILLCGYPPFHGTSNKEKLDLILAGDVNFEEYTWKTISSHAKQLIRDLLAVDPHRRPSAKALVSDPWVRGDIAKQDRLPEEVIRQLHFFNARRKFRAAAFASIVSNKFLHLTKNLKSLVGSRSLSGDELQDLVSHFKKLSTNGVDVALGEFEAVLEAMKMRSLLPLAPRIFDLFDHNRDGAVDMREIVCGFTSLKQSHGDEALKLCFQMYDSDGSGYISKDELASMLRALPEECLPGDITEPGKLDEMFDRMDANSDGRVSFDEFKDAIQMNSFLREAVLFPLRA